MANSLTGIMFMTAIFCAIIALIVYHMRRLRLYREAAKFTGPGLLPVLGNGHYFVGNSENILDNVTSLMDAYPSPFRIWLGQRLLFGVYEPDHMKNLIKHPNAVIFSRSLGARCKIQTEQLNRSWTLTSHFVQKTHNSKAIFLSPKAIEKADLYKFARPWLGTGLLTAPAVKWRVHRKLIAPTFNQRILDSFVEVFAKQSEILVEQLRKELNKDEFEIFPYLSLCTLDIICETAMGVTVQAQTGNGDRFVKYASRVFEIIISRMVKVWLHPDFIFNMTTNGRKQRKYLKYMHSLTNDVIQKKKIACNNANTIDNKPSPNDRTTTRKAFLDLLMELSNEGEKFTDAELREEVDTMMIAGTDTTASVNSFVMFILANFPEVQDKVYEELCKIYGDDVSSDTPVKIEDLNRMEYMERVIKETMRIFPVAAILVRHLTDDIKLGEQTVPGGSSVMLGIMKVHRMEKYWPDPMKFDPDRFLPENVAKRHPYCYVPFSAGSRNCIGLRYAMMAMKALIATVLRRYILKKDKIRDLTDIKLKIDAVVKPVEPLTVRIVERAIAPMINGK